LIDYDGVFIPGLQGLRSIELGHPNYQHPQRNVKDYNAKKSKHILSINVGTAQFDPENPISMDELLSKADALMYAQKRKRAKK
jgi:GGDEF domain-containing protein